MQKELLIIIPAYNEEKSIEDFLTRLFQWEIEKLGDILVINDGSTDDTVKIAKKFKVIVLEQIYNMGYGAALQVGYKYAERKGYKYVIQLDSDGQHDVSNIRKIYDCLINKNKIHEEGPDIVIGSRFLKGSISFSVSRIRMFAIYFFRIAIKVFTHEEITDPTSGLQGLNQKAFSYYATYKNFDYKYPDINMIVQMILLGYKVKEIPAIMHKRKAGEAMHSGVIRPIKYMILMIISTINAILRNKYN